MYWTCVYQVAESSPIAWVSCRDFDRSWTRRLDARMFKKPNSKCPPIPVDYTGFIRLEARTKPRNGNAHLVCSADHPRFVKGLSMSQLNTGRPRNGNRLTHERGSQRLHQVRTVRINQNQSLRTLSRRSGISISKLQAMEDERADVRLSQLYQWHSLLEVPSSELLLEPSDALSSPIRERACLVRMAKTVRTLLKHCPDRASEALAKTLLAQLTEIMPDLKDVTAWNEIGTRRSLDELGRAAAYRESYNFRDWDVPVDIDW